MELQHVFKDYYSVYLFKIFFKQQRKFTLFSTKVIVEQKVFAAKLRMPDT